jgi:hypothetical protein
MKTSDKELREEFHQLDLRAINGRLLTLDGIKRWQELFKRYYNFKSPHYQGIVKQTKKVKKH